MTTANPYIEGEGLGTPECPAAPVSSRLLAIVWAGFGPQPSDGEVKAVLLDDTNNGDPTHDTSDSTIAFVRAALLTYAKNEEQS